MYNLDENDPTIKQPKGLKIKLKPHQLTSIAAMRQLEKEGSMIINNPDQDSGLYKCLCSKINDDSEIVDSSFTIQTNSAILADKVGSGKTYMILGLILSKQVPKPHERFMIGSNHFSVKMVSIKEAAPVNLIVVPHNLVNQWETFTNKTKLSYTRLSLISDFNIFFDEEYVDEKVPGNVLTFYYPIRKTSKLEETLFKKLTLNKDKVEAALNSTKIFLLNVNKYKLFKMIFASVRWARVIIDEMDSSHIPIIFDEYGNFNWFVTATPRSIFAGSSRRYANKIFGGGSDQYHLLDYFTVRNKEEYVDSSMVLPNPQVFMIQAMLQRVVSAIQDLIPEDVLQLINAGNMKEAVSRLNCNVDTEENIVRVLKDKIETELHNLKKELTYIKQLIPIDEDAHNKKIKKLREDIERCKTRINTIDERIGSLQEDCCFICADSFDTPTILHCCKSIFCLKCVLASFRLSGNKCPNCRHPLTNKEYHIISKKKPPSKKVKKTTASVPFTNLDKSDVLEHILTYIARNEETPRILIFSDYSQTFDKILGNIAKAKLQYSLISGTPTKITNTIEDFRSGLINVLLLDSQHYGSGLNLQAANYVIMYHRMRTEIEIQVIGRAQRYGRKQPLKIIYLVNDSEDKKSQYKLTNIENDDELWMITNPPEADGIEMEHISDDDPKDLSDAQSDDEESSTTSKKSKKLKKSKKQNNKKALSEDESESPPSKKKSKKKRITNHLDSDLSSASESEEIFETPRRIFKTASKRKIVVV